MPIKNCTLPGGGSGLNPRFSFASLGLREFILPVLAHSPRNQISPRLPDVTDLKTSNSMAVRANYIAFLNFFENFRVTFSASNGLRNIKSFNTPSMIKIHNVWREYASTIETWFIFGFLNDLSPAISHFIHSRFDLLAITDFASISNSKRMGRIGWKLLDFFCFPAFITDFVNHGFNITYGGVIPCL